MSRRRALVILLAMCLPAWPFLIYGIDCVIPDGWKPIRFVFEHAIPYEQPGPSRSIPVIEISNESRPETGPEPPHASGTIRRTVWTDAVSLEQSYLESVLGKTLMENDFSENGLPWVIDFENHMLGVYDEIDLINDWNGPDWYAGRALIEIVRDQEAYDNKSAKVRFPKGQFSGAGGGVNWKLKFKHNYEELYCAYRIKFSDGFDFVKGGKLPGMAGGTANTGGVKPDGQDGWSARIMWRSGGKMSHYVYHPDQPGDYGDYFEWKTGPIEVGKWHVVQTKISMNTPGTRDGAIQVWLDDLCVLDRQDLRFRDTRDFAIDTFHFCTFYGGGDSSWAARKDESIYLDDFIFSRHRIGPIGDHNL